MKEQLISFETAKLAKATGFIHMEANCYGDNMCYQLPDGELVNALKGNTITGYILAPTQSLLQKWLREVYNKSVIANNNASGWYWELNKAESGTFITDYFLEEYEYETYEEALEIGLQETLKLITKKIKQ